MRTELEVTTAKEKRLRVGLLVDSFLQPRWIYSIIEEIQSSSIAEVVLVVRNDSPAPEKNSRLRNYWKNRHHLLYAAYNRFDELKTKPHPDAFETADIAPLLADVPVLGVVPAATKFTDRFPDEDVEKIKALDLDVALRFGFRILKGSVLQIAKYGVWSFHHGDGSVNRGGPAGFWEIMEGEPVTGAMLQVLSEELDNGQIIFRSWSPTSDRFSARLNRNHYYWKVSTFVMRALKRIHAGDELVEADSYRPYSNQLYTTPTNRQMMRLASSLAAKYVVSKARSVHQFHQWSLAYRFKTGKDDPNNSFYKFKFIIPPKDRFWADPFPIRVNDKYFVFIEEYLNASRKGHISVIEVNRGGHTKPVTVLEKNYHLSYPCIFRFQEVLYMIPETRDNQTVELYRCTEFPTRWELDTVLFENVNATDATVMEHNGKWWMFVNLGQKEYPTDWDELSLFYADSPKGPWQAHRRNPIKSDVRGSRPAGHVFNWRGHLYRPAQNSSKFYGYGMSINKIKEMSTENYEEELAATILPRWNPRVIGTHTLNSCEDLTVIDCLMRQRRF